jgi:hypothetical protein
MFSFLLFYFSSFFLNFLSTQTQAYDGCSTSTLHRERQEKPFVLDAVGCEARKHFLFYIS